VRRARDKTNAIVYAALYYNLHDELHCNAALQHTGDCTAPVLLPITSQNPLSRALSTSRSFASVLANNLSMSTSSPSSSLLDSSFLLLFFFDDFDALVFAYLLLCARRSQRLHAHSSEYSLLLMMLMSASQR
jgi:hypothetical protein